MGASNIGGPVAGTPSLGRLVGSIAVPTEIPQTIAIVARRRPTADGPRMRARHRGGRQPGSGGGSIDGAAAAVATSFVGFGCDTCSPLS